MCVEILMWGCHLPKVVLFNYNSEQNKSAEITRRFLCGSARANAIWSAPIIHLLNEVEILRGRVRFRQNFLLRRKLVSTYVGFAIGSIRQDAAFVHGYLPCSTLFSMQQPSI